MNNDGYREMPDGSELVLNYLQAADHGSADSAILATAVQSDLKNVGIHMEILSVENLSDYQTQGNFDLSAARSRFFARQAIRRSGLRQCIQDLAHPAKRI